SLLRLPCPYSSYQSISHSCFTPFFLSSHHFNLLDLPPPSHISTSHSVTHGLHLLFVHLALANLILLSFVYFVTPPTTTRLSRSYETNHSWTVIRLQHRGGTNSHEHVSYLPCLYFRRVIVNKGDGRRFTIITRGTNGQSYRHC
ncbi:hypothetical protein F5H01DRAFT_384157, partial [Linnemannia elongata]